MRRAMTGLVSAALLLGGFGMAEAFDRRIRIKNETGQEIVRLSASSSESGWAGQVLGRVPQGKAAMATIDDGSGACSYDFVATLADGSTRGARGVNVCDMSVFVIQ